LAKVRQNKELKEFQNQDKWNRSFQGKFQENLEIAEFLKANHSIQNSGNSTRKVKWNGNFIFKNFDVPSKVSSFLEIQTRIFYQMESAQYFVFPALTNFIYLVNLQ